jgi:hypothetical protein
MNAGASNGVSNAVALLMSPLMALLMTLAMGGVSAAPITPVLRDPVVPEALRHTQPAAPTSGEALRAQVQRKLRQRFEAADSGSQGHITRAQADAAGWGYVAQHFNAIDTPGHGSVSWAQVQAYLAQRQLRASVP